MSAKPLPTNTWRWLGWVAVLLLGTILLMIGLVSAKVFDPPMVGGVSEVVEVESMVVPAGEWSIVWLETERLPANYTLNLTASHQSGELDSGYGLVVRMPGRFTARAMVSPLGYVGAWLGDRHGLEGLDWQVWPHVRPGTNQIQLHSQDGQITARINGEWLWAVEWLDQPGAEIGLIAQSFGEEATIDFSTLTISTNEQQATLYPLPSTLIHD